MFTTKVATTADAVGSFPHSRVSRGLPIRDPGISSLVSPDGPPPGLAALACGAHVDDARGRSSGTRYASRPPPSSPSITTPSGDPPPSAADVALTVEIVAAGQLLDIELLDHLIIGQGRWRSLKRLGLGFPKA